MRRVRPPGPRPLLNAHRERIRLDNLHWMKAYKWFQFDCCRHSHYPVLHQHTVYASHLFSVFSQRYQLHCPSIPGWHRREANFQALLSGESWVHYPYSRPRTRCPSPGRPDAAAAGFGLSTTREMCNACSHSVDINKRRRDPIGMR